MMSHIENPLESLSSLQNEIKNGIPLRRCSVSPELKMFADQPLGNFRFTFIREEQNIIKSFASFMITKPINGLPCVAVTFAVPPEYRKQKLASEIVVKGIHEMRYELQGFQVEKFFIEATVPADNEAANNLAAKFIPCERETITDEESGTESYRYLACVSCR